jgi:hypothetical protein
MTKIIGISGKKQSGKNTSSNWLHGLVLKERGLIEDFNIDNNGKLVIKTRNKTGKLGWGIFDLERKDDAFTEYAEENMWPHIKMYSFAESLKSLAIHLFGLLPEQVYGLEKDKNSLTQYMWEDMPILTATATTEQRRGRMTSREFMQFIGRLIRKIYPNAWVNNTMNKILSEKSELAVIPDVRFPNEVESIINNGGKVIRLTRLYKEDNDESETSLDPEFFDQSKFSYIIDNANTSIAGLLDELTNIYRRA